MFHVNKIMERIEREHKMGNEIVQLGRKGKIFKVKVQFSSMEKNSSEFHKEVASST